MVAVSPQRKFISFVVRVPTFNLTILYDGKVLAKGRRIPVFPTTSMRVNELFHFMLFSMYVSV